MAIDIRSGNRPLKALLHHIGKFRLLLVGGTILLIILFFAPIFHGTVVKSGNVPFTTVKAQDSSVELGNTRTKQKGINGTKSVVYSEPKSLFNFIFGGGNEVNEKVESSTITKQPVNEVVDSGTLKYQYMYCSNGAYRYYTNAQFANPSTGFTHKSQDYCAQNNEGKDIQLANTPPGTKTEQTSTNGTAANFSVPNCTTTAIPYGVDYKNASWLPSGQTQTYAGMNGTYFSCLGTSVQPLNETVYTGTGTTYNAGLQEEATSQAREKCTDEYNSARAQIDAAGAGTSSAADEVGILYQQCLNAAG